jgi:hypothetical protein
MPVTWIAKLQDLLTTWHRPASLLKVMHDGRWTRGSGQENDGQEYGETGSRLFIFLSRIFLSARWGLDLSLADRWSFS